MINERKMRKWRNVMTEYKPFKEGKVREIYDVGDSLIMVATDRISCFDVILKNNVDNKGKVLTQMSKFWFDYTKDILPNHMISVDTKDMPEFFRTPEFEGRSMMCKKLEMLPLECIVRGYITGSGWKSYQENGTVCGIKLPEGLRECDKLPEPIYTLYMMRIFHMREASLILRSSTRERARNMQQSLRSIQLLFTRSVQIMLLHAESSLLIQSSNSVLMRMEIY